MRALVDVRWLGIFVMFAGAFGSNWFSCSSDCRL